MSLIIAIILGAIVGWIGARLVGRHEGFLGSAVIGIIGAIIGNSIGRLFGSGTTSYMTFTWASFIWSVIGAAILAALLNAFSHRSTHHNV